jgi:hypothetical protein
MITDEHVNSAVTHIRNVINFNGAALPQEYFYSSLSLCVIDSVFSIGVRYEGVQNVVENYCEHRKLSKLRIDETSSECMKEEKISDFIEFLNKFHDEKNGNINFQKIAEEVFNNRQRTSSRGGILKAQAVYEFAKILVGHKINSFANVKSLLSNSEEFENDIKAIRGQRSGISTYYFYMLAGSDEYVKPDRMVLRFLEEALEIENTLTSHEAFDLLRSACIKLKDDFQHITPRLLDYLIWNYQRAL